MSKYAITYHYRTRALDGEQTLADPEYWDGQQRIEFETDTPIGSSGEGIDREISDILGQIGRANGYTAVALAERSNESGLPWIENLDGEAFVND